MSAKPCPRCANLTIARNGAPHWRILGDEAHMCGIARPRCGPVPVDDE